MSEIVKLYNLNMCSLLYSNYVPIKLLRDKMVTHKKYGFPISLGKLTNPILISYFPYLGRVSPASVAAKTGKQLQQCLLKHWVGHKAHPSPRDLSSLPWGFCLHSNGPKVNSPGRYRNPENLSIIGSDIDFSHRRSVGPENFCLSLTHRDTVT